MDATQRPAPPENASSMSPDMPATGAAMPPADGHTTTGGIDGTPEPAFDDDTAAAKPSLFKRAPWLKWLLLAIAAAGLIYGVMRYMDYRANGRFLEETNDAYVRADGVTVSAKIGGYVKSLAVAENQQVTEGTPLIAIDPVDYETKLAAADSQIDTALAQARATAAGAREAEAGVRQAQAAVDAARRDYQLAVTEIARFRPLVAAGAEPKVQLDQLIAQRDKAAANVRANEAQVEMARRKIATIGAQEDLSRTQAATARVQRQAAQNDISSTRLAAPVSGRVAGSNVRVGQLVQPGARLMTIVPTDAVYVEANFKETQIGLMRVGQPVKLHIDALPDVDFHGTVESISPGTGANFSLIPPENATGNFTKIVQRVPVRVKLDAGPEARKVLVPGLSVRATVDTRSARGNIDAIRAEQQRRTGAQAR